MAHDERFRYEYQDDCLLLLHGGCGELMKKFLLILLLIPAIARGDGLIIRLAGGEMGSGSTTEAVSAAADDGVIGNYDGWEFTTNGHDLDGIGYPGGANSSYAYTFYRFELDPAPTIGATVTSAYLKLYGTASWLWVDGSDDLLIFATDADNASAPTTAGERPSESGGSTATTTATASWNDITWTVGDWNQSTSITGVIQELVDSDYITTTGDHIVLWVRGTNTSNHAVGAHLYEYPTSAQPAELYVAWTTTGTEEQVSAGGDDAHIAYYDSAWEFTTDGHDHEGTTMPGGVNSNYSYAMFRFQLNPAPPSGSTITSASVFLYGRSIWLWSQGSDDLLVFATDADNASAPTTAGERPSESGGSTTTTTATAAWNDVTWSEVGAWHQSSDISSVIQELVDSDYITTTDDHIVIWVRGTTTTNHVVGVDTYEYPTSPQPAKLNITWTE
jgi:hypothetical protein